MAENMRQIEFVACGARWESEGAYMGRIGFAELEDRAWFPAWLRSWVVDHLSYAQDFIDPYEELVPVAERLLRQLPTPRILDLCSGAGAGPCLLQRALLSRGHDCEVWLSDLHPNLEAFRRRQGPKVRILERPLDATAVPADFVGVRTLFNSFHHLAPSDARVLLQQAAAAQQPVLVVETAARNLGAITIVGLLALSCWWTALAIRPWSVRRMLFTYAVPVIPMVVLVDGLLSCLRTYSAEEIQTLVGSFPHPDYEFLLMRPRMRKLPVRHFVLVGQPRRAPQAQRDTPIP